MSDRNYIKDEQLLDYVKFQANRIDNGFTEEELSRVDSVFMDYHEPVTPCWLHETKPLKKLKEVTIRFAGISDVHYNQFKEHENLEEVTLDNCNVWNPHRLAELNLKSLTLYNCHIEDYSFISKMSELRHLTIVHDNVDAGVINTLKNLEYLNISSSTINNYEELNLRSLRDLYIDGSNIKNLKFLRRMPKLETLGIDEDQYFQNMFRIIFMVLKRVEVLLDGLIDLGSLIRRAPWDWLKSA